MSLRNVVAGQRVPMELTSLGRAWLAVAPPEQRTALLALFRQRRGTGWPALQREIEEAAASVRQHGYCVAAWQPEVVALAAPIVLERQPAYLLNMSVSTPATAASVVRTLRGPLLALAEKIGLELLKAA